ncbi:Pyridoxal phosphate phosphatase YigL [Limihaloglobus sulfuriphilus]|uniref:Pyridoxal phosphate phosphatase YigL n=1 Tax=Limihaloglobus sulfuriphilus TaxID=1851148 RepID=A0A1Q2MCN6_9BACT|nr:HAD hydrolase family protein [Limihaloglobus sulfuriphilus]AQQ70455.1 Pyridoxal phosphate phosphatase YigL [Limihaloglobus sulfuriphilus]
MHKRIYISDLDGTLLNNDPALSEYSQRQINHLIESGVEFTIASARNIASLRRLLGNIQFRLPVIEINGAFITDYHSGKHLVVNDITSSLTHEITKTILDIGCMPFICAYDGERDNIYYEQVVNGGMEWFLNDDSEQHTDRIRQIETLEHIHSEQIVCYTVIGPNAIVKELSDAITAKFADLLDCYFFQNIYSPQWYWLTIHDRNARKEIAIKKLIELYGYSPRQLTVFGDQLNDEGMMLLNKIGSETVAVENAAEKIKQIASKTIGVNIHDSVVNYILEQNNISPV